MPSGSYEHCHTLVARFPQIDPAVPDGCARDIQPTGRAMSEAGELLRRILETGDIVGQDSAGRTIVQLAVDRHMLGLLTAFGADAAERDDGGDDEPYEVPPVSLCWLDAARTACRRIWLTRA
jgi:hypothetical protein